ncbi:hypothetical protein H5410_064935 [Solanum commersonii]|uniref:Uncharacterized protein n=1 Tax=Solanum commersonii TaxID=4109 RepID=A0A9J5VYJ9_SOLCO|nr:hypothetical protein H5410_064935 [Solanum commersonii]
MHTCLENFFSSTGKDFSASTCHSENFNRSNVRYLRFWKVTSSMFHSENLTPSNFRDLRFWKVTSSMFHSFPSSMIVSSRISSSRLGSLPILESVSDVRESPVYIH